MNIKTFIDQNDKDLTIKSRKHAITFENNSHKNEYKVKFHFDDEQMAEIVEHIIQECNYAWVNFRPREIDGYGSDYFEYYDRKLDNNGFLGIRPNGFHFERPVLDNAKLYQFNKAKAQSFVHDLLIAYDL